MIFRCAVSPLRPSAGELRQDPHVRHRPARRRELSRIRQLPAGRNRRDFRPALGPHRADDLLRRALSGALSCAGRERRVVPHRAVSLHPQDRRGALARPAARPRHRDRLLRVRRGASRPAREQARDLWPFADRRSLGRGTRRGRRRARRLPGQDRPGKSRDRAQDRAVAAARPALRHRRSQGRSGASAPRSGIGMIRYNLRCEQGHAFESWFQSSSAYEAQVKRKLVNCPVCGSAKVEKAIMAPRIVSKKGRESAPAPAPAAPARSRRRPDRPAADGAGARAARQAQGIARSHRQERRQCRRALSQRSAQDALRRHRAPPDLRRGLARGSHAR